MLKETPVSLCIFACGFCRPSTKAVFIYPETLFDLEDCQRDSHSLHCHYISFAFEVLPLSHVVRVRVRVRVRAYSSRRCCVSLPRVALLDTLGKRYKVERKDNPS